MKNERLVRSIGSVADKYIQEAAPQNEASGINKASSLQRKLLRYLPVAACVAVCVFATTAFAASYIQNSISSFYLRYLSPEDMAIADSMAEQYGADIYFDALKSGDLYKQYFAINKLVEYYNDDEIRERAIRAIRPFLSDEPYDKELSDLDAGALSDAAAFALSVLTKAFDDPRIIHMADGTIIITLFNDYSDYGTYNQIWRITDDELSKYLQFDRPLMYIKRMIPSPDRKLLAVSYVSNKSGYLEIFDIENNRISPELIDSARVMVANDRGITYWQRPDFENYSGAPGGEFEWLDNDIVAFNASLWYPGTGDDDAIFIDEVIVQYDFKEKHMEYVIPTSKPD